MPDPYEILGVSREATHDEICKVYRTLAKKSHPDLHPGDKAAESHFKEIASAYAILGDETKRAAFDSGKIDASGAEQQQRPQHESYRHYAEAGHGFKYDRPWTGNGHADDDLFAELFGRRGNARGHDVHYTVAIDFIEAIRGAKKRVVMGDSRVLDITIPAGLRDGQTLRLRGQGATGVGQGGAGDVLVEVHVKPHGVFQRDGDDIRSTLPVTLGQALAGAKIVTETVSGAVTLTVPKGSNTGKIMRLRGKGVPTKGKIGDHLVELKVVLPEALDEDLIRSIVAWEAGHPYDPRKTQGAAS